MNLTNKPIPLRVMALILLVLVLPAGFASAQMIYLTDGSASDSVLITTGVGTEFELYLMADENLLDWRGYVAHLNYDKFMLDTVLVNDTGSIFNELGEGYVVFHKYLREDSTILRVESLLFGYGLSADGPGLLATIKLRATGTGAHNMFFDELGAIDVNGDSIQDLTGEGLEIFINAPPSAFDLALPDSASEFFLTLEDSLKFEWHPAQSPYPGDFVEYILEYGTDPGFGEIYTTTIPGITDTFTYVATPDLDAGPCYWRVFAYNAYDSIVCNQTGWFYNLDIATYPDGFNLLDPASGADIFILYNDDLTFSWEPSGTSNPDDYILYDFMYSTSPVYDAGATTTFTGLTGTSVIIPAADLMEADTYYWKVRAYNKFDYVTWGFGTDWYFTITVAANPALFSLIEPEDSIYINLIQATGMDFIWHNSESVIPDDTITYTLYFGPDDGIPGTAAFDTASVIDTAMTMEPERLDRRTWHYWCVKATNRIGFDTLSAEKYKFMTYYRGDSDGSDDLNILDVTHLINYLYKEGAVPYPIVAGDANCSETVNLLDVTYLINYLYKGGPPPICP